MKACRNFSLKKYYRGFEIYFASFIVTKLGRCPENEQQIQVRGFNWIQVMHDKKMVKQQQQQQQQKTINSSFLGLATSCRWIPKKLPIKVSKSCQKVAIFFKKLLKSCWISKKLPKFFCFSYLFWVLKIKNSHIASYQNFICQSPMIISEVLFISHTFFCC